MVPERSPSEVGRGTRFALSAVVSRILIVVPTDGSTSAVSGTVGVQPAACSERRCGRGQCGPSLRGRLSRIRHKDGADGCRLQAPKTELQRRLVPGSGTVRSSGSVGAGWSAVVHHSRDPHRLVVDPWARAQELTTSRRPCGCRSHCLVASWARAQELTTSRRPRSSRSHCLVDAWARALVSTTRPSRRRRNVPGWARAQAMTTGRPCAGDATVLFGVMRQCTQRMLRLRRR